MPIPKKSSWPFFPLLYSLYKNIESLPAEKRADAALKTIERCVRLALKLAVHYGVPVSVIVPMFETWVAKEGGAEYQAELTKYHEERVEAAVAEYKASPEYAAYVEEYAAAPKLTGKGGCA